MSSFSGTGESVALRKELGVSIFVGLNSGSSDTSTTSDEAASPESAVMRKKPYGSASMKGFTFAERKSVICGVDGSSVRRRAVFEMGPEKFFVSTVRVTFPSPPGLITLSNSGTVQPHEGLTSVTWRSACPVFLRMNTCLMGSPFGTVPTSFLSSGTTSFGPDAVSAALAGAGAGACARRAGTKASVRAAARAATIWRRILEKDIGDSFENTVRIASIRAPAPPGAARRQRGRSMGLKKTLARAGPRLLFQRTLEDDARVAGERVVLDAALPGPHREARGESTLTKFAFAPSRIAGWRRCRGPRIERSRTSRSTLAFKYETTCGTPTARANASRSSVSPLS